MKKRDVKMREIGALELFCPPAEFALPQKRRRKKNVTPIVILSQSDKMPVCQRCRAPAPPGDTLCLDCFAYTIHLEDLQAAGRGRGRGRGAVPPGHWAPANMERRPSSSAAVSMGRGDGPVTPRGRLAAIHAEMWHPRGFQARAPALPRPEDLEDASSDGVSEEANNGNVEKKSGKVEGNAGQKK